METLGTQPIAPASGDPVAADRPSRPGGSLRGVRVDSLTGLRWFAALAVFCFHSSILSPFAGLEPLMRFGNAGVIFFFLLSGFVLTWSARATDSLMDFYCRRLARIWPLLFVTTAIALAIQLWWKHGPFSMTDLLLTLSLTQAWSADHFFTVNVVTWTLSCEAFFYLVFPLLLKLLSGLRKVPLLVVATLMELTTLATRAWPGLDQMPVNSARLIYSSPLALTPMFVVGMCAALAMGQGWRPFAGLWPSVLLMSLAVGFRWSLIHWPQLMPGIDSSGRYFDLAMIPPFALLIASAAQRDSLGRPSLFRSRPLVKLGEWSFAFYLVHALVIDAFQDLHLLSGLTTPASRFAMQVLLCLCGVVAAAICHLAVERPADKWVRGRLDRRRSRVGGPRHRRS